MTRVLSITSLLFLAVTQLVLAAGPRVDIVIGEKAPPLERRAAENVAVDLKKLYDAEVKIVTAAPDGAENVIFIGSPQTNIQVNQQIREAWPKLSDQGHALRTIKYRGRPALFIAGGSPAAAFWAASEYAYSLGIRSMLFGDLHPISPHAFSLENYETVLEPSETQRIWQMVDPYPTGYSSWGLDDQKKLLRQLARLKFNQVVIHVRSWQPFVHFEFDGVKKKTGVLWYGWQFPVNGDTAGRSAFKGAKLFENPDFSGKTTYEQRLEAGQQLIRGLIAEARELGMFVALATDPLEFPNEFAAVLPGSKAVFEPENLAIEIPSKLIKDELTQRIAKMHVRSYKDAYPKMVGLVAEGHPNLNSTRLVADLNHSAHLKSRKSFDSKVVAESACRDLVSPVCGDGVDGSVLKALSQLDNANSLIEQNEAALHLIDRNVVLKHFEKTDAPPEWWSKVRDNYLGAMNDMYRANSRAREGGRSYTLYLARRCEFGYEYMNCVEATRKAGIAKSKKDTAEQRAQLEKAIESMNAACSALAAVARDQSDRGMIAVCNEFGYKALQKELEKLDAKEGK